MSYNVILLQLYIVIMVPTSQRDIWEASLRKKAETQIKLEKNGVNQGWISVECKRSRNRGFETFSFTINENGLPEFVDNDYDL